MEALFETLSIINNSGLQQALTPFRWILAIIGILFLLFSVFVVVRTTWLKHVLLFDSVELLTFRPYGLRKRISTWQKILQRLETTNEAEYKLAVIEADAMLNDILLRMGFRGETLGDRLKTLTTAIIPNLNDVSIAHQARNNVVHDPDYRLTLDEAQKTLEAYETAFSNLDLI
tara:strand:- start:34 stop:552 length:519 start_codon:yes stop_codon:yes gene_type:complete